MRKYASFFQWPDRERAELGIVEEMIETLSVRQERKFSSPQNMRPDPPDCFCLNEGGQLVAVEVAEIVCTEAVRLNEKGHDVFRNWQPGELPEHVGRQLHQKDGKHYFGGPYSEFIVCMFTDEVLLSMDRIRFELSNSEFGPFNQLTGAYILLSYDPLTKGYPVHTLKFRQG